MRNSRRFSRISSTILLSFASGMVMGGCGSEADDSASGTGSVPPASALLGNTDNGSNSNAANTDTSPLSATENVADSTSADGIVEGQGPTTFDEGNGAEQAANGETATDDVPVVETMDTVTVGNGRFLGSACVGVCADASTDANAAGELDGWGFENGESCVVPDGVPASQGAPCDRLDLLPEQPAQPQIPEGNQVRPTEVLSTGFFVANGRLFDRLGNDFIMRGVNHPVAWYQNDALLWIDEIAETGANSVRLVWETDRGATGILRQSIARAIELDMVPMIELHDVTGGAGVNQPAQMAEYYVSSLSDILSEFEDYLLVNIANEWGDFQTSDADFGQAYRAAIDVLRGAGINHTLVIDGSNWGQNFQAVHNEGQALLEYDAQHNLLFSVHMYESYENPTQVLDALNGAVQRGLPLIVGEFGFQHGNRGGQPISLPFEQILAESERLGLGYLAWSWTGNSGGVEYLDLSVNGTAEQLTGWGDDLVNGPNGIRATAAPAGVFLQ